MSDADALLDVIWAAPNDDLPRLAYADWLEEHGFADYAHFIRLSCRLSREVMRPDDRTAARRERFELGKRIAADNPAVFKDGYALLHNRHDGAANPHASCSAEEFLRDWPHWWPYRHPRSLTLWDVCGHESGVTGCPYLARVETLHCEGQSDRWDYDRRESVDGVPIAGGLLGGLAAADLARLTTLKIEPITTTAADLLAFAGSPLAGRLSVFHARVQFPDGSRESLWSYNAAVAQEIHRFVTDHAARFDAPPSNG